MNLKIILVIRSLVSTVSLILFSALIFKFIKKKWVRESFIGFLLILILSLSNTGCTKSSLSADVVPLHQDKNFVAIITTTDSLITSIKEEINNNKIEYSLIKLKLEQLVSKNVSEPEQVKQLENILGSGIALKIQEYSNKFSKNWTVLNTKNITSDQLQKECELVFKTKYLLNNPVEGGGDGAGCGWRYYICMAAATAGAIICHSACVTTGPGVVACVALCLTLQAQAAVICSDNYCSFN